MGHSDAETTEEIRGEARSNNAASVPPQPTRLISPGMRYTASVYAGPNEILPQGFVAGVKALEQSLGMPIWLLVQRSSGRFDALDDELVSTILAAKQTFPEKEPIALLIDSAGGFARSAYQIARLLKKRCGGYIALVTGSAKSAATLLTLGADRVLLSNYAELGPLDAQYQDPEREDWISALDEVQALERLHAFSLQAVDATMFLMLSRTRKKVDTLLPLILRFVTDMVCPLFEKIDAVHYTQMSRSLKVAEEYATRLLQGKYSSEKSQEISRRLVHGYPEHGFVIDAAECATFGLETHPLSAEQETVADDLRPYLQNLTAIGFLKEADRDEK